MTDADESESDMMRLTDLLRMRAQEKIGRAADLRATAAMAFLIASIV